MTNALQTAFQSIPTLLVLVLMGGGWMMMHHINATGLHEPPDEVATSEPELTDTLLLPEGKLRAGGFQSEPAEVHSVQHLHTVPGRLRYDATKHVAVKSPMDGVLAELLVTPGDTVCDGALLAVVRSSAIGQVRSDVLKQIQQRELVQQVLEREESMSVNLARLTAMLDAGDGVDAIEAEFKDKSLGGYRQDILSAYAKLLLAEELVHNVRPLVASGSVSGKTLRERESERQLSETAFRTARDQAQFAVDRATLKARADAAEAQRQVDLAWQSLDVLLGCKVDRAESVLDEDALSRLDIRAPFAGSIESCAFAMNERVARGDDLLVLANTDTLYVEANIRESDWPAVALQPETSVVVRVPALEDREFEAKVHYVGREVDSATNSVPLVATMDNAERLFRPGMFVRVTVPVGAPREVLSVTPESVLQHENQDFVFVDLSDGSLQRLDVVTGQSSEDWVEVTRGLSPGQLVVTKGAFFLKSELLLQGEE